MLTIKISKSAILKEVSGVPVQVSFLNINHQMSNINYQMLTIKISKSANLKKVSAILV